MACNITIIALPPHFHSHSHGYNLTLATVITIIFIDCGSFSCLRRFSTSQLRLLPLMLSTLAGGLLAARVLGKLGTRWTISLGLAGTALGLVPMLALGLDDQYYLLRPSFLMIGFTLEVALVAANDVIISSVPADESGQAAAIEETAYELGSGFGVAVLGSILAIVYTARIGPLEGVTGAGIDSARESLARALEVAGAKSTQTAGPLIETARLAFMSGYHVAIAVSIALVAGSAVLTAILLRPRAT